MYVYVKYTKSVRETNVRVRQTYEAVRAVHAKCVEESPRGFEEKELEVVLCSARELRNSGVWAYGKCTKSVREAIIRVH